MAVHATSFDPADWDIGFGRFDAKRWRALWQGFFDAYGIVHDRCEIQSIQLSPQADAALAVLDVDTLWVDAEGGTEHWIGRVSKAYTRVATGFKLIQRTGALQYGDEPSRGD